MCGLIDRYARNERKEVCLASGENTETTHRVDEREGKIRIIIIAANYCC